ncbi:MAG: hypothetical protein QNJ46_22610 [Leptolyngbyaceae cyanobacterium MO_188.B28]|nr:hypothetical protein [Leptolyngbyaceae cyanobacterium MO_188.B28]
MVDIYIGLGCQLSLIIRKADVRGGIISQLTEVKIIVELLNRSMGVSKAFCRCVIYRLMV